MPGLIGSALGWDKGGNGLYSAFDQNRNAIASLSGAVAGQPDAVGVLGALATGGMAGRQLDLAEAAKQAQLANDKKAVNATLNFLQQSDPALASLVEAGAVAPGQAYQIWSDKRQKGFDSSKPIEINGQLVDPVTYKVLGDFRTPEAPKAPSMPASYQEYLLASQDPKYAATLSSSSSKPLTEAERRNRSLSSVIEPELKTVEDNWAELSKGENQAFGANIGYGGVSLGSPGSALTSEGYQKARNSLSTIAQSYLYSVSGAAAPAEEVNKLVDSVTPKPFESAGSIAEKKRRVRAMADAVKLASSNGPRVGDAAEQPVALPAGPTKTINGTTYTQDANGDWYQQ